MKHNLILLLFLLFIAPAASASDIHDLNHNWRFSQTGDRSQTIDLPHSFSETGIGNYLKTIEIPADWQGRRLFLRFGAAATLCDLVVNGRHVGQHRGGYTAFTFEITDFVRFGAQNNLLAIVNNSPQPDILPTAGEANRPGGLIRGVELVVASPVAIAPDAGVRIASHKTTGNDFVLSATVVLVASIDENVTLSATLFDASDRPVASKSQHVRVNPKGAASQTLTLPVDQPRRWNGRLDPYLYRLAVTVSRDTLLLDSLSLQTGFREIAIDAQRGLLLNGAPYPLRGVMIATDRPGIGPALRPRHLAADIAIACEMGANFLVALPQDRAFYELCDRAGILVMSQLPLLGAARPPERAYFPTSAFRKNGSDQLTQLIRQQSAHLCVAIWSLFDGLSPRGDDPTSYVRELNELAKKLDPSRPTACLSNADGEINLVTDLLLWRHTFGWTEGQPADIAVWLAHLHRSWSQLRSGIAYTAGGNPDQQAETLTRPDPASHFHPENYQTYLHQTYHRILTPDTSLWAIVAGNLFDGPDDDLGLVSYDRTDRKAAYRFYRSAWNP